MRAMIGFVAALLRLALPLAALFVTGCAHTPFPERAAESPYPPQVPPSNDTILHVATGRELSRSELFDLLSDARVIFVSEAHNNVEAHRVQAEIIEGLASRFPDRVAVGMEMFPYTAQEDLDRVHREGYPEEAFNRLWDEHWNVDPVYYASVMDVIRRNRVPLIGLNAPKEKVRELSSSAPRRTGGGEEIDTGDPYQRAFLAAIFGGHAKGAGMFEKFLTIQAFWEETMAEKAAAWLRKEPNKGKKLIILAGGNHINYGFGVPRRLFRRLPVTAYSVNPETFSNEDVPPEELMEVDVPPLPLRVSDFTWYVAYRKLELKRAVLGVSLVSAEGGGVKVIHVMNGSPAAAAGIRVEDVLVSFEGRPIKDHFDLTQQLRKVKEGQTIELGVRRGDRTWIRPVRFDTLTPVD